MRMGILVAKGGKRLQLLYRRQIPQSYTFPHICVISLPLLRCATLDPVLRSG
jgi:hypothetical protein